MSFGRLTTAQIESGPLRKTQRTTARSPVHPLSETVRLGQPFTAPSLNPETRYFCAIKNTIVIGRPDRNIHCICFFFKDNVIAKRISR